MKTILWDFDGTLAFRINGRFSSALCSVINRNRPELNITADALRESLNTGFYWHNPDEEHLHLNDNSDLWWEGLNKIFKKAYENIGINPDEAEKYSKEVRKEYADPKSFQLYDDVVQILQYFMNNGWEHIILSNHTPELESISNELGLSKYIKKIINSAKVGYEKPNRKIFKIALDDIKEPMENIWMIGDSYSADIIGATQMGIRAIQVRTKQNENSVYYAESLHGIKEIIKD